jgi:hypothetical protein
MTKQEKPKKTTYSRRAKAPLAPPLANQSPGHAERVVEAGKRLGESRRTDRRLLEALGSPDDVEDYL